MPSVTLQLPVETVRRLRHRADQEGQTLETYLLHLAETAAEEINGAPSAAAKKVPRELPIWEGRILGSLSRRELYDDVD
jgi:hypothetical protein